MPNYIEGADQVKLSSRAMPRAVAAPSTTASIAIQNAITGLFEAAACIRSPE